MSIFDTIVKYVGCLRDVNAQTPPYEDLQFLWEARLELDKVLALSNSRLDDDITKTARLLRTLEDITMPLRARAADASSDDSQSAVKELKSFEKKEVTTRQRLFNLTELDEQPKAFRCISSSHPQRPHAPLRAVPNYYAAGADEEVWALT